MQLPDFSRPIKEDYMHDFNVAFATISQDALEAYDWAISVGIPKEKAQTILPVGVSI